MSIRRSFAAGAFAVAAITTALLSAPAFAQSDEGNPAAFDIGISTMGGDMAALPEDLMSPDDQMAALLPGFPLFLADLPPQPEAAEAPEADGADVQLAEGPHGGPPFGGPGGPEGPGGRGGPRGHMGGGCGMMGGHHGHGHGMFGALHGANALTDDQYEKLYALHNQLADQMGPKMVQMASLHRQLKDALTSSDLDLKRIKDLQSQLASNKADISAMAMDKLVAGAQILTPDQRREMHKAMVHHAVDHRGGMMHHHHG